MASRSIVQDAKRSSQVQDLHEVASDDEKEGHDESIPVFDSDTDDDTDSVIDALQRDLEGDAILADTFIDSLGSDFVNQKEVQSTVNGRPQRRLVLVKSTLVLDASGDARVGTPVKKTFDECRPL